MKGADGNSLEIIQKIAAGDYERFGTHLLQDANGTRVKLLKKNNNDPESVTWKILQQWLESDAAPHTYQHLMECLQISGLSALAVSIGNAIGQGAFTCMCATVHQVHMTHQFFIAPNFLLYYSTAH